MEGQKDILLVALGGNALIRKGERGTVEEQFRNLRVPMDQIARLSRQYRIILTHGNGPQVGNLLLQQSCCQEVPGLPLEILVAQTQGQIGYMIESTLDSALMDLGIHQEQLLVSLLSYVVVDRDDPAFQQPSKPIGPVYGEDEVGGLPFPVRWTAKGYRRVVASPEPLSIVERREIKRLIDAGFIVICCGGGGIPVIREARAFQGVEAVIDKDLASARLAMEVGVDVLLMATDVEGAATGYGTARETFHRRLNLAQAELFMEAGHFPPGSMGPKVEAAVRFIRSGGRRSIICSTRAIEQAVEGLAGTEVVR